MHLIILKQRVPKVKQTNKQTEPTIMADGACRNTVRSFLLEYLYNKRISLKTTLNDNLQVVRLFYWYFSLIDEHNSISAMEWLEKNTLVLVNQQNLQEHRTFSAI